MERIVLEVNNSTAKKWRSASNELRTKLNKFMDEQLAKILENNRNVDTIQFFNELRTEMAEKGLTQEALDDILKDED